MSDEMMMKMEAVTLTNVAGGTLEEHFQELLKEVGEVFAQADEYEESKAGVVCKMSFDLEMVLSPTSGSVSVYARGDLKRPKRKLAARGLYRHGEKWFVYDEPQQSPLFDQAEHGAGNVRELRQRGSE